jgi:hypothetical protein
MKKQIIPLILCSLLALACYRDKGNYDYKELVPVVITGLDESYTVYSYQDILTINPAVANEERYDYCWQLYNTAFNVNARLVPRPDTLALTKNLSHPVYENPGAYILVFCVRDKETGYTEMTPIPLTITTVNMTGWYILKDDGSTTDFDFFAPGATTPTVANWISFYNDGTRLDGKAVKASYIHNFKMDPNGDNLRVFVVASERDASIVRIDNGEIIRDYNTMFFTPPATRRLQNVILEIGELTTFLVNDGLVYTLTHAGGLFYDPSPSPHRFSSHAAAIYSQPLFFDEQTKSFIKYNYNVFTPYNDASTELKSNNLDADVLWMEGYNYPRWKAYSLFKRLSPPNETFLVKMQSDYNGASSLIGTSHVIPDTHALPHADCWAGNFTYDIIYFARDNKLYRANMDVDPIVESLQFTLPAGEVVTCMQHMNKSVPQSPGTVVMDCLAVASHANGRYKVWLFAMDTGNLVSLPGPTFEGEGRVTCINYVQPDGSLRIF